MIRADPGAIAWSPDRRFWVVHLWVPLAVFALLAALFETTGLDLWIADRWYALEGGRWALRDHWFTYGVMHHDGKIAVIAFGAMVVIAAGLSCCVERLKRWRLPLAYVATGLVLVPAAISYGKHFSDVPCPWDLARYGGEAVYRHTLSHPFSLVPAGTRSCFPSGHAAGGFGLLVLYFGALPVARRPSLYLLPGLLVGLLFGLGQQARGSHFVSHDIWALALTWFCALGLFLLFRPGTWGRAGPAV